MAKATAARGDNAFGIGSRIAISFGLAVLLVAGAGGWAAIAQLNGAVIAQGAVAVDQNLKSIQHRDGGIVSAIAVREGDHVAVGQVLIRLEDAQTRAELSIVRSQLVELAIRKARLQAERDGLDAIVFPPGFQSAAPPEAAAIIQGETRLFTGNRTNRTSQKRQLQLSIEQIEQEVEGLSSQLRSKGDEIALLRVEHEKLKSLAEKQLIEGTRLYTSDRDKARLLGEQGEITAAIARARTRISEIQIKILSIDEAAHTDAQRELSLVETKMSEFHERKTALEDRLDRTDIRAPISGVVNELNIHTIGGVITPAEILATIVPEDAKLKIEVRFAPSSIDQISVGQPARLRFSAFNRRTTPELAGMVAHLAPATARDPATGEHYYLGAIQIPHEELARLEGETLMPGMPVEIFVTTDERTALSYLVKPITDQFNRAFRER